LDIQPIKYENDAITTAKLNDDNFIELDNDTVITPIDLKEKANSMKCVVITDNTIIPLYLTDGIMTNCDKLMDILEKNKINGIVFLGKDDAISKDLKDGVIQFIEEHNSDVKDYPSLMIKIKEHYFENVNDIKITPSSITFKTNNETKIIDKNELLQELNDTNPVIQKITELAKTLSSQELESLIEDLKIKNPNKNNIDF